MRVDPQMRELVVQSVGVKKKVTGKRNLELSAL